MTESQVLEIGPFVAGEKPNAIVYQFLAASGAPIDITGYTVRFVIREHDGTATTYNATLVDAVNGKVQYVWTGAEFPTPGQYLAEFWVGNLTQRFASWLIKFDVRTPVGVVPAI